MNHASYDDVLFMGDAVDYGPFPFEVYSRLSQVRAKRVLGNHDVAAALGIDCRSNPQLREASVITRERITVPRMPKRAMQALVKKAERRMDLDYAGLRIRMVHASPTDELYQYVSKEEAPNLEMRGTDLLLLGHTHIPYEVKTGDVWIVNPGSVGMPRDGNPRASYAILDTFTRRVQFEKVEYNIEETITKLHQLIGDETRVYQLLATILRTGDVGHPARHAVREGVIASQEGESAGPIGKIREPPHND